MHRKMTLLVLIMILLTACTAKAPDVQDVWEPYIGTCVGDNGNVSAVANNVLDLGDTIDHFDLRGEVLHIIYRSDNESLKKWFDTARTMKETIIYNAMMAAVFVPNAYGYAFSIDDVLFEVTREALITEMSALFETIPQENEFFDKAIVSKFLQLQEHEIRKYAKDITYQKSFFSKFPLSKIEK
ncbi:hypothetical protein ACIQZG_16975 [Lysinibacillus sp. NPDC096418]|uniref:hypothetical protein n=1 Tax=Lysinibacillus sp. NPDC096418 TaxID=3364138 RepID=UPI0037FB1E50